MQLLRIEVLIGKNLYEGLTDTQRFELEESMAAITSTVLDGNTDHQKDISIYWQVFDRLRGPYDLNLKIVTRAASSLIMEPLEKQLQLRQRLLNFLKITRLLPANLAVVVSIEPVMGGNQTDNISR